MARVARPRRTRANDPPLWKYEGHYLDCRNLGHVWATIGFFEYGGRVRRRLMCQRCQTDRTDSWGRDGQRYAPKYEYADGYRMEEGISVKPYEVRQEIVRRAVVYEDEAAMLAAITTGAQ